MIKTVYLSALILLATCIPLRTFSQSTSHLYYREQQVTLSSGDNHDLYGTLTIPAKGDSSNILVIIPGSGPTDRDGNQYGALYSNTYRYLAEGIAARGFASLRFDKRGVGASAVYNKDERNILFDTYVNDVVRWIAFLKKRDKRAKITVAGHSEGALVGMLAASKIEVDGYISIAGLSIPFDSIIRRQIHENLPAQEVYANKVIDSLKAGNTVNTVIPMLAPLFRPSVQPFLMSIMKYNPAQVLSSLTCRILLVQGDNDMQVKKDDVYALSDANPRTQIVIIHGMNHVLKIVPENRLLNMQSYHSPTQPISQELITNIAAFIQ